MRKMQRVVAVAAFALGSSAAFAAERPKSFVDVSTVIPDLVLDMRYTTAQNFIGKPIDGYGAPKCYLTTRAAEALKRVQNDLRPQGYGLKVYDCYRPQTAVNEFVRWGRDLKDEKMKPRFYPNVRKSRLFRDGYIASRSGHSRGSTVDLTVVPLPAPPQPAFDPDAPLVSCEKPQGERAPDNSIDMGTGFDCFSVRSHTASSAMGNEQKVNRKLLKSTMSKHGFRNVTTEWWHYTLRNEPYKNTYFDFPIE